MTETEFFNAYNQGQRHFYDLDFEYLEDFSDKDFSGITFKNCFLYVDFRNSNLTNACFLSCNIKEIDLRKANLTNALMTNCLVESAMFKDAIVDNFKFVDNCYYGHTIGQKEFDKMLLNSDVFVR